MSEYIVGMDIGSSKICSAIGKLDKFDKVQISGVVSLNCSGLKKGVVINIDDTAEVIKNSIEQLERIVDTQITGAYISLPGGISELIENKGIIAVSSDDREISKSDVERVIKSARNIAVTSDKEIIGVIPRQFTVDGYDNIKDPIGMSGLRLEVDAQVVIAQTTVLNNLFKSVNKAGIKVKGILLEPLAAAEAVLKKEEIEMGTVLLNVGSDVMDIAYFKGGSLHSVDRIPLGGNSITNDIAVCLKIPSSEAEKLKIKYAAVDNIENPFAEKVKVVDSYNNSMDVDISLLSEIIEARLEELFILVDKKLNVLGINNEVSGFVIIGGGVSNIKGITQFSRKILKKPVRIGVPEYVGASSPSYSTSVGIVKNVLSNFEKENMINEFEDNEKHNNDSKKVDSGFISRMRNFFADFF